MVNLVTCDISVLPFLQENISNVVDTDCLYDVDWICREVMHQTIHDISIEIRSPLL